MTPPALTMGACAEAALESESAAPATGFECDHCGKACDGEPGGAGLLLWTRGEEVRFEEPPLCGECASRLTIGALFNWDFGADGE